jgi:hypothetical protein
MYATLKYRRLYIGTIGSLQDLWEVGLRLEVRTGGLRIVLSGWDLHNMGTDEIVKAGSGVGS